jgi:hypothetical protein
MSGDRGVFAVDRGVFRHPMFKPEPYCERAAWLWLVAEAGWDARRVRRGRAIVELNRGQLAASRHELAKAWMWTENEVRGALARWEKEGAISRKPTSETTIITLCNYDEHQFGSPADPPATHQPLTGSSPAAHQHTKKVRKEEGKKERKERERVPRAKARAPLPEDWKPSDIDLAYAADRGFDPAAVTRMACKFFDHHRSRGNLMADWAAAWRTWVNNEIQFQAERSPGHARSGQTRSYSARPAQTNADAILAGVARSAQRRFGNQSAAGGGALSGRADPAGGDDAVGRPADGDPEAFGQLRLVAVANS